MIVFLTQGNLQHEWVYDMFNRIDRALLEIDFDVTACTQRAICWHVKNSIMNVEEKKGGKIDKFVAGFVK